MTSRWSNSEVMPVLTALLVVALAGFGCRPQLQGVEAADPDPVQDFCVADLSKPPLAGGYPCKPPEEVTTEDFAFSGLGVAANLTGNPFAGSGQFAFVTSWPALNTQGLSLVRLDINPGGVINPHTHPLATEILFCLEGEIYTGFVTNSVNSKVPNKLYAKVVKPGEAFIFPRGLLHFQLNKGTKPAVSVNVLNGQDPGVQLMNVGLFGTGIDPQLLARSFFMTEEQVAHLASTLSPFASPAPTNAEDRHILTVV